MDYQKILDDIDSEIKPAQFNGKVASYIPELANVQADQFGMHICCLEGGNYAIGAHATPFSIQSISKVFSLTLALLHEGNSIWERVDVEPSGDPFNSLVQLEYENGIPRNPLINAGALVICDILVSHLKDPKKDYLAFIRKISGNPNVDFNLKVAASEKKWGFRNSALTHLMKSFGNIKNDVEEVLDFYFHKCSIEMSCQTLAQTFLLYANHGCLLSNNEKILTTTQAKRINAIMQTCGFYDEAGEFSFRVGLPGKSGVGGGIAAIHPGAYSVVVWSPKLNPKGNSSMGMAALELLTTKSGLSIF